MLQLLNVKCFNLEFRWNVGNLLAFEIIIAVAAARYVCLKPSDISIEPIVVIVYNLNYAWRRAAHITLLQNRLNLLRTKSATSTMAARGGWVHVKLAGLTAAFRADGLKLRDRFKLIYPIYATSIVNPCFALFVHVHIILNFKCVQARRRAQVARGRKNWAVFKETNTK